MRRKLIARALAGTASRLESGFRKDVEKRENRLRGAIEHALAEEAAVKEVRIAPEWRPEMPLWPRGPRKRLGGFDVAVRFQGDDGYSLVVELKWTHYGFVNALDEAIWDAFKLAHASSTLPGVRDALLIYLAPLKAWNRPARFAQLFADSFTDSRELIGDHENIWHWCLREGSAAKPLKLPPALETGPIARAPLVVDGEPWEIRAAVVRANGEPWFDLDPDGLPMPATDDTKPVFVWPDPEPGPGMVADDGEPDFEWPTYDIKDWPTEDLRPEDVPSPSATWSEIIWFAAHFDGYDHFGHPCVAQTANASADFWREHGKIDQSLDLDGLRGCLFFEHRRYRHFGHAPSTSETPYIRALVEAIRQKVIAAAGR